MSDDPLILTVGGREISGWETVRVTRGIERCPSDFDISLTDLSPGQANMVVVQPGDDCTVKIGSDLVITGYVDRFNPSITPTSHNIRITGRGKCQDLVDCAAQWPNGQITGSSALQIAQNLAGHYNITVNATQADVGPPIPQIQLILGETSYEIIERICRFRGLLAYELSDGSLLLDQAGTMSAASGFSEGQNVQHASIEYSMDQRFSEYLALLQSMDVVGDLGDGGNLQAIVNDSAVTRPRRMVIIAEYGDSGADVCKLRANWEMMRRAGRSQQLTLTTDSWRDSAGALWVPNTLAPLMLPSLKLPTNGQPANWLIAAVTYYRDENGTTADLVMMPPEAFKPQPVLLNPSFAELTASSGSAPR